MEDEIIGDPLFQLNLVLFISLPVPPGANINPILYNSGYRIVSISPTLSVSTQLLKTIKNNNISSNSIVKPEVLIKNSCKNEYVLVECKKSSFSSNSTTCHQANAYLMLSGNHLRDLLGESSNYSYQSKLLYFVKAGDEQLLVTCLEELSNRLEGVSCQANEYNVCGIGERNTGIYCLRYPVMSKN